MGKRIPIFDATEKKASLKDFWATYLWDIKIRNASSSIVVMNLMYAPKILLHALWGKIGINAKYVQ